jgi:hypothetical protein
MSVYSISLFLHVVGALGLFAALGLEWAGLFNLRRATETSQAREWVRLLAAPRFVGGPAALVILISGIYMSATRLGPRAWAIVALTGMVVIAVLGAAVSGRRSGAIARALPAENGPISTTLAQRLQDPVLPRSLRLRVSLFLGIVFLMSTRPGWSGSVVAMAFALVVGLSGSLPSWSGARRQARMAGSER